MDNPWIYSRINHAAELSYPIDKLQYSIGRLSLPLSRKSRRHTDRGGTGRAPLLCIGINDTDDDVVGAHARRMRVGTKDCISVINKTTTGTYGAYEARPSPHTIALCSNDAARHRSFARNAAAFSLAHISVRERATGRPRHPGDIKLSLTSLHLRMTRLARRGGGGQRGRGRGSGGG